MATPDEDRLDQVGDEIDAARRQAEDDGLIPDPDHPQRYYESGETKEEDDQSITPP